MLTTKVRIRLPPWNRLPAQVKSGLCCRVRNSKSVRGMARHHIDSMTSLTSADFMVESKYSNSWTSVTPAAGSATNSLRVMKDSQAHVGRYQLWSGVTPVQKGYQKAAAAVEVVLSRVASATFGTRCPFRISSIAVVRPETPAPITQIEDISGKLTLVVWAKRISVSATSIHPIHINRYL
jgi:hypothetical protein